MFTFTIYNKVIANLIFFITKNYNQSIVQERIKEIINNEFKCLIKQKVIKKIKEIKNNEYRYIIRGD